MNLTERWSRLTVGQLTAAAFAGERVLLGDEDGLLVRVSMSGEATGEAPLPAPVRAIAATEDGSAAAVVSGEGTVTYFKNRKIDFQKEPGGHFHHVLMGPEGDYLVLFAADGRGLFMNRFGREMGWVETGKPIQSVALIPVTGQIVVVHTDGTVRCLSNWGKPQWETQVMHAAGPVRTDESGDLILIPMMAYGVEALTSRGESVGAYDVGEAVKGVACAGDAESLLLATSRDRLVLMRRDAQVVSAEVFPAPIVTLSMSRDGRRALITTASGYAHVMDVTDRSESPLLELGGGASAGRSHYLLRKQVYSPYSLLLAAKLRFSPDASLVAIAGDRRRIQVLSAKGNEVDSRRFAGSLLDLDFLPDGDLRVYASQSVYRFHPGGEGTSAEWTGHTDLALVTSVANGDALAMSEDGRVIRFGPGGPIEGDGFHLPGLEVGGLASVGGTVAVVMGKREVVVHTGAGEAVGKSGPWPIPPKILAASDLGYLVGVGKLMLLLSTGGEELWRHHLSVAIERGVAIPGAFAVSDRKGTLHSVTASGMIRPAFESGKGSVVPFPDSGDGPGFLLSEGPLLSAVRPDGHPLWRFRAPENVSFVRTSPDGRVAGMIAGIELYLFSLSSKERVEDEGEDRTRFLEFADG